MRKDDKERRDFLRTFKPRMIEIQEANAERLGGERVPEAELDAAIKAEVREDLARTQQPNSAVKAYHGGTDSAEQAPPSTEATFDVVERIKGRFRYELRDPVIKPETVEDMKILLDSHDEQQREIARLKLALHQATCKDCAIVASGCCVNYRILEGELYSNE